MIQLFQIILTLISPFVSIFFNIFLLTKKNRKSIFFLSFNLAIIFVYFPIMYDTSMNFYISKYLKEMNYIYSQIRLYNLISIILSKINLEFMQVILFYTFFIFYIKWLICYKIIINSKYIKSKYLFVTLFFLGINYREVMDLNRFYLSIFLFFLGCFVIEKKIVRYCLFFLSFCIHRSIFLAIIFYFISLNNKKIKKKEIKIMFVLIFINIVFRIHRYIFISILFFLKKINIKYYNLIYNYSLNKVWGEKSLFNYEAKFLVIKIISTGLILILLYYIYKYRNNNYYMYKFYISFVFFLGIVYDYRSFYERYSLFVIQLGIIVVSLMFAKERFCKVKKPLEKIILLQLIYFISINIIGYGYIFTWKYQNIKDNNQKNEYVLKAVGSNLLSLINIKKNGYSDKVIYNISKQGKNYDYLRKNKIKIEEID